MSSRIVVLGGTGFLGFHLCTQLKLRGFEVVSVSRRGGGAVGETGDLAGDLFQMTPAEEDLLLRGADICVHLATDSFPSSAERAGYPAYERNLGLAFRVADACVRNGVRKLIFSSSGGTVYGRNVPNANESSACAPIGLYGAQKIAIETMLRSRLRGTSCSLMNLRIGNPYGAGQEQQKAHGVVGHLLRALITETPFTIWGDGSQVRDYIYIDDVIAAFINAIVYSGDEDLFNIGSGVGTSTLQLVELCQEVTGRKFALSHGSHPDYDVDHVYLDVSRARDVLGWGPIVSLRDGIGIYHQKLKEITL